MKKSNVKVSRVVYIHWKNDKKRPIEVFSNLKNLSLTYPQYNYNTLNNYLSKDKSAFENDEVRIERINLMNKPYQTGRTFPGRDMALAYRKTTMKNTTDDEDVEYWLHQPPEKRIAALTAIRKMFRDENQETDRSKYKKLKRKK